MTANKNTNDSDDQPNNDSDWEDFLTSHTEDLGSIEGSHTARKFEREAKKTEAKKLIDASQLTPDSFASGAGQGPRDYATSWLDADDALGTSYNPGPVDLGSLKRSTVTFAIFAVVGVLGLILSLFIPRLAGVVATVAGVILIIGATGLLLQLRGHNETKTDPFDDGARV